MTPGKILASALAAVVAISGIGGILIAQHQPRTVDAVQLQTEREAPAPVAPELKDPAIRRDDDVNGLETLDDDDDDASDDGVTSVGATRSVASAASAPSKASVVNVASAPSASVASADSGSADSGSADSDD